MDTIFSEKPFLKVKYYPLKGYILFKWHKLNIELSQLKIAHKKALKIAEEKKCFYFIADTSEASLTLTPEVIGWWRSEWVPKMQKAGIKVILTILPKNYLSLYSTDDWHLAEYKNIILQNVKDLEEAEMYIKKLSSNNAKLNKI
jgi:hypothetical protein